MSQQRCKYVGCLWRAVWQFNVALVCITVLEVRDVGRSVMLHMLWIIINGAFRNWGKLTATEN